MASHQWSSDVAAGSLPQARAHTRAELTGNVASLPFLIANPGGHGYAETGLARVDLCATSPKSIAGLDNRPEKTQPIRIAVAAYELIEHYILDLIEVGGERTLRLPTDAELIERFGVSRMTVRRAMERLVLRGFIVRYPGRGTYANRESTARLRLDPSSTYPDSWAFRGRRVVANIVKAGPVPRPAEIPMELARDGRPEVGYLERVRYVDGHPASWDERWMPVRALAAIDLTDLKRVSLLRALPDAGFPISAGSFTIRAGATDAHVAALLEVPLGESILERQLSFYSPDGTLVVYGRTIYAPKYAECTINVVI